MSAENPAAKPDRRTRRTRRLLKEALFACILEKGYDAVTIEDITRRADLGRTTFYLHYRDKEELLLESVDAIAEELLERIPYPRLSTPPVSDEMPLIQNSILIIFQHAYENAPLYRVILRGEGAARVSGRLQQIISQVAAETIRIRVAAGQLPAAIGVPLDIFVNYFAGALQALITWWLESGTIYSPEEMALTFYRLFFIGGRSALLEPPIQ